MCPPATQSRAGTRGDPRPFRCASYRAQPSPAAGAPEGAPGCRKDLT
ncbi:hypothetical protein HMPREF0731_1979 [Pseudoroseomonas cervicalis ATCC 49957]|uniref:Uncharacterized protein n=1 Tax=Pseudoroseomonas cervicalis ATCC 49957 TaxID=525371 RepID=D5RLL8_9PROT|nr:hypothetical protein HMPREF0731_1979 [Pseudoroseomonas cervicalis ATCC 49957]